MQTANELCNDFNTVFTQEVREKAMGLPGIEYSRTIVETLHLPVSPEKYYELSRQKIQKLFPSAKLMPGIKCNQFLSHVLNFISDRYRRNLCGDIFNYLQ